MANADPRLITDVADLEGRTIAAAELDRNLGPYDYDDWLWLRFTDGTACLFRAPDEQSISLADRPDGAAMVKLGLGDAEEFRRRQEEAARRRQESQERADREQYERLRARFEGK